MPAPRTADATRHITARLTDAEYNHLVAQAHMQGLSLSEALRQALERDIDAQPGLGHGDDSPGTSMAYRTFLQVADFSAALEELDAS